MQLGTNQTFYFQSAENAIPAIDLVIADIAEGLHVPGILIPLSSIPSWNAKSDKFLFVLFLFCMQYFHDDGALLIFHPKWTKELSKYFFNYNFKVDHEPWTCVNLLRLTNHRNPNKTVSLTTHVHHIFPSS